MIVCPPVRSYVSLPQYYSSIAKKKETSADWDQETLEKVVEQKHGSKNRGLPPTTIVCKYFLDAVEKGLYGWFWQCPNGDKCH